MLINAVAPFVGAWIEIVRCIERYPKYMSLPSLEHRLIWKKFIWEKYLQKIQMVRKAHHLKIYINAKKYSENLGILFDESMV